MVRYLVAVLLTVISASPALADPATPPADSAALPPRKPVTPAVDPARPALPDPSSEVSGAPSAMELREPVASPEPSAAAREAVPAPAARARDSALVDYGKVLAAELVVAGAFGGLALAMAQGDPGPSAAGFYFAANFPLIAGISLLPLSRHGGMEARGNAACAGVGALLLTAGAAYGGARLADPGFKLSALASNSAASNALGAAVLGAGLLATPVLEVLVFRHLEQPIVAAPMIDRRGAGIALATSF